MTLPEFLAENLELIQDPAESTQEYLNRVVVTISNLDEAVWDTLPEEMQSWYNDVATLLSENGENEDGTLTVVELPPFPDYEPLPPPDPKVPVLRAPKPAKTAKTKEPKAPKEPKEPKAKKEPKEPKAKKEPKAPKEPKEPKEPKAKKEPKAPKEPKEPKEPRGPVAATAVREILCNNMELSIDEVLAQLEERGIKMQRSSCQVVHLNTVRAFQVAQTLGTVKLADGSVILTTP